MEWRKSIIAFTPDVTHVKQEGTSSEVSPAAPFSVRPRFSL